MATMTELEEIRRLIREFRDARDWRQFHNPKNLACSIFALCRRAGEKSVKVWD
jgi:hypothetical protein